MNEPMAPPETNPSNDAAVGTEAAEGQDNTNNNNNVPQPVLDTSVTGSGQPLFYVGNLGGANSNGMMGGNPVFIISDPSVLTGLLSSQNISGIVGGGQPQGQGQAGAGANGNNATTANPTISPMFLSSVRSNLTTPPSVTQRPFAMTSFRGETVLPTERNTFFNEQSFRTRRAQHKKKGGHTNPIQHEELPTPPQNQNYNEGAATGTPMVWTGGETSLNGSIAQVFAFNGVPILLNSSMNYNNNNNNNFTEQELTSEQQGQSPSLVQPHSIRVPVNDTPAFQNAGHRHMQTTDTAATNFTIVNRDIISNNTTNTTRGQLSPSAFQEHVRHVLRNDQNIEYVNYEQIERVRMMHARFSEGCQFSFNYNTLLLVASILAGLGLASNSGTTVIASMLVSPIMGPVVGMAYAMTIHDFRLLKKALITECLSLLWCIIMGVILAACIGPTSLSNDWPTQEMTTRGTWQNFLVALPVAFFSGLGVAVGLLDEQVSSLVGVAISASLLPPAVNSGLLWTCFAFLDTSWWDQVPVDPFSGDNTTYVADPIAEEYEVVYERKDFRQAGVVSILLTLVNILLVSMASMIMFRVKERLPIPSKNVFWEDLGVARKIYRNLAIMDDSDNSTKIPSELLSRNELNSESRIDLGNKINCNETRENNQEDIPAEK